MIRSALVALSLLALVGTVAPVFAVGLTPADSIQAAIDAAIPGDTITLSAGIYNQHIDFKGKNVTIRSTNPTNATVVATTVLDGSGVGTVVTFSGGETAGAALKGLTIRNGVNGGGGGIMCIDASPTIMGNLIMANQAAAPAFTGLGGGIYVKNSSPSITRNIIRNNSASDGGAGIAFENSGGLCLDNQITNNSGHRGAGVLLIAGSSVDLKRNLIQGNSSATAGGGVYISGITTLQCRELIVRNNSALTDGGGIYAEGSVWRLANSVLDHNAALTGGGLALVGGTNTIASSTLDANSSGVHANAAGGSISNCIITSSTRSGTGFGVTFTGATVPSFVYCNVWNNIAGSYSGLVAPSSCLSTDPMYVDAANAVYNLKSQAGHATTHGFVNDWTTSPCIDAGAPRSAFALETAPNGGRLNMGFEGNTTVASHSISGLLIASTPGDGATDVNRRTAVNITFQHLVQQASAEAHFTFTGAGAVAGTISWPVPNKKLAFTPTAPLAGGQLHTIALTAGIKMTDSTLLAASETRTFTTGDRPIVTAFAPKGTTVNPTASIAIDFDVAMGHGTTEAAFSISPTVLGTMRWAQRSQRLIFNPTGALATSTLYRVTIARTARSAAGVQMGFPFSYQFTTAASGAPGRLTAAAAAASAGTMQFTVGLTAAAEVSVQILNLAGRTVAVLPARPLPAGVSSLLWNGKSITGTTVPPGAYLARVTARGADGQQTSTTVPVRR